MGWGIFFFCVRDLQTLRAELTTSCSLGKARRALCFMAHHFSSRQYQPGHKMSMEHLIPSPSLHSKTSLRTRERGAEDGTVGRATGPSGSDGSDLPAPQPSQAFASSLAERVGRTDRLCSNSPWCSHDAGWQRQLTPILGQAPAEKKKKKARRGEPRSRLAVQGVPKSKVPIPGVRGWPPPTLSVCPWEPHAGVKQSLSSRP